MFYWEAWKIVHDIGWRSNYLFISLKKYPVCPNWIASLGTGVKFYFFAQLIYLRMLPPPARLPVHRFTKVLFGIEKFRSWCRDKSVQATPTQSPGLPWFMPTLLYKLPILKIKYIAFFLTRQPCEDEQPHALRSLLTSEHVISKNDQNLLSNLYTYFRTGQPKHSSHDTSWRIAGYLMDSAWGVYENESCNFILLWFLSNILTEF